MGMTTKRIADERQALKDDDYFKQMHELRSQQDAITHKICELESLRNDLKEQEKELYRLHNRGL